jgi:uncharacterized repeat protein (TIGR01451 family)
VRVKLLFIISIFLISLLSISSIAQSDISVNTINNNVKISEPAEFQVKINNNLNIKQRYSIYSLQSSQGWNVAPDPLQDRVVEIGPGKSKTVNIKALALEEFNPGIYFVHLTIEGDQGDTKTLPLKIYLSPEKQADYLPSIKVEIDMDERINPREPVPIKLFIENRNPLDMKDLIVKIQSDIPQFSTQSTIHLPSLEKKTVEFTVVPNKHQQPKEYTLFFVFEHKGDVAKIVEKKIEILSLLPEFEIQAQEDMINLKKFMQFTISNPGNVKNTQEVKYPLSFFSSLFTSQEVKSINEERFMIWNIELSPDEQITVNASINYRILAYIIAAILFILIFYWAVKLPISIKKKASTRKAIHEETLSQIKITLEVKNISNKPIKNVTVVDIVPAIANVEKSLELGTLRPSDIKHQRNGTKVTWTLAQLDAYEHRLITYKIKAKLNILGTFSLPRGMVEFSKKENKKLNKAFSNIAKIRP